MEPVYSTELQGIPLIGRGKVRDIYDFDDRMMIVASDRLSAFDVILPSPIPDKGKVLTQISAWWFSRMESIVPNHMISVDPAEYPEEARAHADLLTGRSMLVRKAEPLPVECVIRGYLAGSGWKDYQATSSTSGIALPAGLELSSRLPEPIFTPATKAEQGDHDENISFEKMESLVGTEIARKARDLSIEIYMTGSAEAAEKGIIIADTKFEFGLLDGELILIDHPRFFALLAGGHIHHRRGTGESRQAVRARLPGDPRLGQDSARPGAPRGDRHRNLPPLPRHLRMADGESVIDPCGSSL